MDLHILFVDLRKAFDSVDRELLWKLLNEKFGIPVNIIRLLRLLHDGMHMRAVFRGKMGTAFGSTTGVRQGSLEGPVLWLLYYHAIMTV